MLWVVGLCVILFIVVLLLFSKMNIHLHYSYSQDGRNDLVYIVIRVYHILVYRKHFNLSGLLKASHIQDDPDPHNIFLKRIYFMIKNIKSRISHCSERYKGIRPLLQKIQIRKFTWETDCGTGDAMTSGTTCGAIWSAKGIFLRLLRKNIENLREVHMNVNPHFQQKIMATELNCIVSITIGKAILAFLQVRNSQKLKWKKGVDVDG